MTSMHPSDLKIWCCFHWLLIRNSITNHGYVCKAQDLPVLGSSVGSVPHVLFLKPQKSTQNSSQRQLVPCCITPGLIWKSHWVREVLLEFCRWLTPRLSEEANLYCCWKNLLRIPTCVCYFSHCCEKMPGKTRKKGGISAHSLRMQPITGNMVQECEAFDHIALQSGSRERWMLILCLFPSLVKSSIPHIEQSHSACVFPSHLNLSRNAL